MSDSTPSVCKTISWLLAIFLVGAVALYSWHNKNQTKVLAGKDAQIAQSAQLLGDLKHKLAQSEEASGTLRADKQELTGKLETADQAYKKLQNDMEALKLKHAQTLAAEQEKARQAHAEVQEQRDAANKRVAALGEEIAQLKQSIAEAKATQQARLSEMATAHEAQTQQIEQQLKGKIEYYRTALEGSEPERAAQLVDLERQVRTTRESVEAARQKMQTMQAKASDLDAQLTGANQAITERDQALSELEHKLEALTQELTQEQSAHAALHQEHEATIAKTTESLAKLQQDLKAAEAAHDQTKTKAAAAMKAASEAHATRVAEAESKISNLTARLQAETTALGILQQEREAKETELRSSLNAAEQSLAGVKSELSATKEAAAQAKQTYEQQIAEAQSTIDGLEGDLVRLREKAASDLAASKREGEESVAYVRGIYTEISELGGHHTDQGMLLSLAEDDLRFRISKADLPDGEIQSLDRIAELLAMYPKLTARIEGHTDSKGRDETNLELSQKRADAVKQALIERGVDEQRLTAIGIGAARPIADNATSAGRRKNRRVEVYVTEN
jgi:outer membrane protein OmpA-like peptidoglycan-associated protein